MASAEERLSAVAAATARERALIAAKHGEPMPPEGEQLTALLDLARAMSAAGIMYALIGGVAVGFHSEVARATQDVDVAVPSTVARPSIISALGEAGFSIRGEFEHSVNLRHANGEPVQVAFDRAFDEMIDRAETVTVDGVEVRIVRKDDLITMKTRAASDPARRKSKALRDQADVELLRGDVPDPDEGW